MTDFQKWIDKHYIGLQTGTVKSDHVFTVKRELPTKILRQKYADAPIATDCQDILPKRGKKKLNPDDRVVAISYEKMTEELEQLPAHGMDPLKAHNLFKNGGL